MWHLRTKFGTFWVVPVYDSPNKFYLGVNDEELGLYTDVEQAAKDVLFQNTGYLKWDCLSRVHAPHHINQWNSGAPNEWSTGSISKSSH